jgi:hypothetical protein
MQSSLVGRSASRRMKESSLSVISARGALGGGPNKSVMFWLGENGLGRSRDGEA